jgi:phosphatidylserine/phosphatidylglycerophosphate/cardiolipin synthase-like enzyme
MPSNGFSNAGSKNGFAVKLWRGERMCLVGMDVDQPEADLVGFAIEVKPPGATAFHPLLNRLAFSYPQPATTAVTGERQFDSREAPFQKFRWVHFPHEPKAGSYTYRVTKMHMPNDAPPVKGTAIELDISLDPVTYDGFLDVGFTRNFASSQAYKERFGNNPDIIPAKAADGLDFQKLTDPQFKDVYRWLGFEAHDLLFAFLDEALTDPTVTLDVFAYDLNEPDIVERLERFGPRLRAVIDDSSPEHKTAHSAESKAAARLKASAGAARVRRTHFGSLQHNKVFIAKKNGTADRVLFGSTNFTFRGLYIQANNLVVCRVPDAAALFGQYFEATFANPAGHAKSPLAAKWHLVQVPGKPPLRFCFSPHTKDDLTLTPLGAAIEQATSSVFFSIAFLSQTSGAVRKAIDTLTAKPVFSYGSVNSRGGMKVIKPDGSIGTVDFAYLAKKSPQPFAEEWSGGKGINVHHKFVVTDFSLPTARVYTGSSNLSPTAETKNGDHLVVIEDPRVAAGYAIEAIRVFDHLHFRTVMKDATKKKTKKKGTPPPLTLRKPTAITGRPAWFDRFYRAGSQLERDRQLFSR